MYTGIYYNKEQKKIFINDDKKGLVTNDYKSYSYKEVDEESEYKTIYGNNVKKTFKFSKSNYEIDLHPIQRVLVDTYYESDDSGNNVIGYIDIETSSVGGYCDIKKGDKEIYSITYYCNNIYHIFLQYKSKKISFKRDDVIIHLYETEEEMLNAFCSFINEDEVTILTTWNGDRFDIPYIVNRMNTLDLDYTQLSPIGIVDIGENGFINIALRSHLDYLSLYKKYSMNDRESYKLDAIGELELGMKKIEYDGDLDELYESNINKFLEYNLRDVEILVGLEKKLDYLNLSIALCHESHIPYDWIFSSSKVIEGAVFTYLKRNKLVSINKSEVNDEEEDKIEGAYVKEPVPGVYKNIIDLDFTSLYPNAIRTLNLSPETKVGKVLEWNKYSKLFYNYNRGKDIKDVDIVFIHIDKKTRQETEYKISLIKFITKLKKEKWTISGVGLVSRTDEIGFIPKIITMWFDDRMYYQRCKKQAKKDKTEILEKQYNIKQYVKKINMNSFYGVLAMVYFRYYDRDIAESVTMSSQYLIKASEQNVNKYFDKDVVIAGDTDSLFIAFGDMVKNKEEIKTYADEIQLHANEKLADFCKNIFNVNENKYLNLKQEMIALSGFWSGKKKYALKLIEKDGSSCDEIETKGIDAIKSSFPKSMKIILMDIIKDILDDKDKSVIDEKLYKFNIEKDNFPINDLGINTGIKNIEKYYDELVRYKKGTPVHVKAALNYNNFLKSKKLDKKYRMIQNGDKIKFFYLKNNPMNFVEFAVSNDVVCKEANEYIEKHIDRDKIVASALQKKIEVLYDDVLHWSLPDFSKPVDTQYF